MKQFSLEEYLKNPEKKDAEKKQKALEKLKKVIENSSINKEHTKSNINF